MKVELCYKSSDFYTRKVTIIGDGIYLEIEEDMVWVKQNGDVLFVVPKERFISYGLVCDEDNKKCD